MLQRMTTGIRPVLVLVAVAALGISVAARADSMDTTKESVDVVGQGPLGPVVATGGGTLIRADSGITGMIDMPTPAPGSYVYPEGNMLLPAAEPGHPEVFALWVFIVNYPDECQAPADWPSQCDPSDFQAGRGSPGVFRVSAHAVSGDHLQLSGHVSLASEPFFGFGLLEPHTAEVHLAVVPHGGLDPEHMPDQLKVPFGTLAEWWLAYFRQD